VNFHKICFSVFFILFAITGSPQSITLSPGLLGRGLVCPVVKPKSPTPSKPSIDGEIIELPSDEEIAALNLPQNLGTQNEPSSPVLLKLNTSPLRVALWGDSHAAARFFSDELIKSFVANPDNVLPTFIPPLMGRAGVRLPVNKMCVGPSWRYDYAYRATSSAEFSRGLAKIVSGAEGAYIWIDFGQTRNDVKLKSLDILYTITDATTPVNISLSIDDGPEEELLLDKSNLGLLKINSDKNFSILKLRLVKGFIAIDGFIPEYNKSAAVYFDTLGIPGATGLSWKNISPSYFRSHGMGDPYDLVIFEYGTNEGNQRPFNLELYSENLKAQLSNMRKIYPESACVLIGPTDRGVLFKRAGKQSKRQSASPKELLTFSKIHYEISQAQKNIGREYGCSFWDWQGEMGGMGGAYRWIRRSPPLMAKDLIHLTVDGYQQSARDFSKSFQLINLNK
jgi:lysophospholipase L1-like esterase